MCHVNNLNHLRLSDRGILIATHKVTAGAIACLAQIYTGPLSALREPLANTGVALLESIGQDTDLPKNA